MPEGAKLRRANATSKAPQTSRARSA